MIPRDTMAARRAEVLAALPRTRADAVPISHLARRLDLPVHVVRYVLVQLRAEGRARIVGRANLAAWVRR